MDWLRWAAIFILIPLVGIIAVIGIGGTFLPERHRASRTVTLRAARNVVWEAIRNFEASPRWRQGLDRVERSVNAEGRIVWTEVEKNGDRIAYETKEETEGQRLVRAIASPELPFGGSWTLELSDATNGCALTLTEDGEVYNPFFRFISRFIIGHHATMDRYISELRAHVEPQ